MKKVLNILTVLVMGTILALTSVLVSSCKRDEVDPYLGPQACPTSDFQITTPFAISTSGTPVNFNSGGTISFSATFNEAAPWSITITGKSSHASKTFSGFSTSINQTWYCRPESLPFFSDETVTVDFKIRCLPDLNETSEVTILSTTNFSNDPSLVYLADFDNSGNDVAFGSWLFYAESDPVHGNGVADTAWFPSTAKTEFQLYSPSPQGGGYLAFKGTEAISAGESKNLYGSYEIYPPSLAAAPQAPEDVWFNFMANSDGTPIKVVVNFWHWSGTKRFGKASFTINSNEWGMYSVNLAELEKGPGIEETFNAQNIGIVFFTVVQGEAIAPSYFNLDMVNFSFNESFFGETKD